MHKNDKNPHPAINFTYVDKIHNSKYSSKFKVNKLTGKELVVPYIFLHKALFACNVLFRNRKSNTRGRFHRDLDFGKMNDPEQHNLS